MDGWLSVSSFGWMEGVDGLHDGRENTHAHEDARALDSLTRVTLFFFFFCSQNQPMFACPPSRLCPLHVCFFAYISAKGREGTKG